jgi:hypothetical protein
VIHETDLEAMQELLEDCRGYVHETRTEDLMPV